MNDSSITPDATAKSAPTLGSLCLLVALNAIGMLCVVWPILPKSLWAWEIVGFLFGASKDPSMGIQFMLFWLLTVPVGGGLSAVGTYLHTRSPVLSALSAVATVVGGAQLMFWIAGN